MSRLDPKELARIKRHARARRISDIRRRVATLGITLVAVFSGTILVRTQLDPSPVTGTSQAATVKKTAGTSTYASVNNNGSESGGDDGYGGDDESQAVTPVTVTPAQTAAVVPAPSPAPLVTSQS